MKFITKLFVAACFFCGAAWAADEEYDGIVLSELGGMQYEVCQLKPGKTIKDADEQTNFAASEFKRLSWTWHVNFTPFYDHATSFNETADYITMVYRSIPAFADGWTMEKRKGLPKWSRGQRSVLSLQV